MKKPNRKREAKPRVTIANFLKAKMHGRHSASDRAYAALQKQGLSKPEIARLCDEERNKENEKVYAGMLEQEVYKLCCYLGMNVADWQIDETLAKAIRTHPKFASLSKTKPSRLRTLCLAYDHVCESAGKMNPPVKIDPKYQHLYGLMK